MVWTHIIIEGYCSRKLSCKKDKYVYTWEKGKLSQKIKNSRYDPKYKTPKKPKYCKDIPNYLCLENHCPHFGYTDAEKRVYLHLNRLYKNKKKK